MQRPKRCAKIPRSLGGVWYLSVPQSTSIMHSRIADAVHWYIFVRAV